MPKTSSYEKLRDKWVKRHRTLSKRLIDGNKDSIEWLKTHSKQLAVGSAASAILLTSPVGSTLGPQQASSFQTTEQIGRETFLVSDLSKLVPQEVRELTPIEEEKLANALSRDFGVDAKVGINGIRLNRTYGMIGQEQHLARFPQDTMDTHFDNAKDAALYAREGMGVLKVGKKIDFNRASGESIGIEKIGKEAGKILFGELEQLLKDPNKWNEYYDDSYTTLVELGIPFGAVDISGLKWVEIDTHEDYAKAQKLFTK